MAIHADAAVGVLDIACGKIQRIDIGDTARAVDDSIGFRGLFGAVMAEDHAQAAVCGLDPLTLTLVLTRMPMRSLSACKLRDRVGIHRRQQLRQCFEDRDVRAGARIDMAEFERDHAAADENHRGRQVAFAQHLVRGDHEFGAGIGSGRGFEPVAITMCLASSLRLPTRMSVGAGECGVPLDDLDVALGHRAGEVGRDVLDHLLLAVDQGGPVELRLADRDMMNGRRARFHAARGRRRPAPSSACSRGSGRCRREILLRSSPPTSRRAARTGYADAGVAAAQDNDIEFFSVIERTLCLAMMRLRPCRRPPVGYTWTAPAVLLPRDRRRDGTDDLGRHLELRDAVADVVAAARSIRNRSRPPRRRHCRPGSAAAAPASRARHSGST